MVSVPATPYPAFGAQKCPVRASHPLWPSIGGKSPATSPHMVEMSGNLKVGLNVDAQ